MLLHQSVRSTLLLKGLHLMKSVICSILGMGVLALFVTMFPAMQCNRNLASGSLSLFVCVNMTIELLHLKATILAVSNY